MHKQRIIWLLMATLLWTGCSINNKPSAPTPSANTETLKVDTPEYGMWWSYRDYERDLKDKSEEEARAIIDQALENMQSLGINRVYVHAVSFTDAFYDSAQYPRSAYLGAGTYDAVKIFTELGHQRGMKIDAWINPMRSLSVEEASTYSMNATIATWIKENNERIRQVKDRYYLNPAYVECRELITSIVREILEKEDVDGIHMDDYFYPSGVENKFDAYIFSLEQEKNPELTLEDFRRQTVNQLVQAIHDTVKAKNPTLVYSISPAGNMENNHRQIYAWPQDWVASGSVDALMPQIYWGFDHPTKPFMATLQEWKAITDGTDIRMIPGLAAYKIGKPDYYASAQASQEWVENSDILGRETTRAMEAGCQGVAYFDYGTLFAPSAEIKENVENEIVHIKNAVTTP